MRLCKVIWLWPHKWGSWLGPFKGCDDTMPVTFERRECLGCGKIQRRKWNGK